MSLPGLSVIIPCYNHGRFLGDAIESVVNQSSDGIEIIVVDDGSTDDTPIVARRFGDSIRYIRQENRGLSAARNSGIRIALKETIAFLDADDRWLPGFANQMLAYLAPLDKKTAGVCCGWYYVDDTGVQIGSPVIVHPERIGLAELIHRNSFIVHAAIVRSSWVMAAGGFDENLRSAEDWDLWIKIALLGGIFVSLDKPLVEYRLLPDSMFHRDPAPVRDYSICVLDKAFDNADLPGHLSSRRRKAYSACYVASSSGYLSMANRACAAEDFCTAVRLYPTTLTEVETCFAVACAHQPKAYRSGPEYLNLDHADRDLTGVMRAAVAQSVVGESLRRKAWITAYQCLAQLAFIAGAGTAMRHYMWLIIRNDPYCVVSQTENLRLAAKALLGPGRWRLLRRFMRFVHGWF